MGGATTFAALAYFIGAYLHQDWVVEYRDLRTAVAAFKTDESTQLRRQLVADIDAVLQQYPGEAALRSLLLDQMQSYRAEIEGLTYRQWLMWVRGILLEGGD